MACMMNNQMTCMHVNVRCMRLAICTRVVKENCFKVLAWLQKRHSKSISHGSKGWAPKQIYAFFPQEQNGMVDDIRYGRMKSPHRVIVLLQ